MGMDTYREFDRAEPPVGGGEAPWKVWDAKVAA